MASLAEALPAEMKRIRDVVIPAYEEVGRLPNTIVAPQIALMRHQLDIATKALAEGDVVQMMRSYEELKEIEL